VAGVAREVWVKERALTDVQKILVVGGGIGGLCTTIALRNAGFAVDMVEKNPAWDVYGVGIIQPGNALRALDELGLAREAVAQGH
jgi:2-polyprenyl-6-methoxyphenol hydroxylase-like FAD-dependent oxidoreductase